MSWATNTNHNYKLKEELNPSLTASPAVKTSEQSILLVGGKMLQRKVY